MIDACGDISRYAPPNRVAASQVTNLDVMVEPRQHFGSTIGMQRSKPHTAVLHTEYLGSNQQARPMSFTNCSKRCVLMQACINKIMMRHLLWVPWDADAII